jgi:hypothetical protein
MGNTETQTEPDDEATIMVTGSREIDDRPFVTATLIDVFDALDVEPERVIHGGAQGVDELAGRFCVGFTDAEVDAQPVPDWTYDQIGDHAPLLRNSYCVAEADIVVAIWDGESTGTEDVISKAYSAGVPLYRVVCDETDDGSWVTVDTEYIPNTQMRLASFQKEDE